MTDEATVSEIGKRAAGYHTVCFSANEYARLGSFVHIDTAHVWANCSRRSLSSMRITSSSAGAVGIGNQNDAE
jgi:hypothetical protein